MELNNKNKIQKISEKPKKTKSNLAITGLYLFNHEVINFSQKLRPSKRNELEITDLIKIYKKKNSLKVEQIGRGGSWLDTGTTNDLFDASLFVSTIEERQGLKMLASRR